MPTLTDSIARHLPALVALRHDLHAHPETGFQEHATAERVLHELRRIPGLAIQTGIAGTGIVATLEPDRPGPCLALRADLDALPMTEETGLPYASTRPGVAHACGHDGHTACLVGAAWVLAELRDALPGPVRFIFQPAEEGGGGGRVMCEAGVLDHPRVSAAFALHGWPSLPVGTLGVRSGPAMAATDALDITVAGVGTHAASPQLGIDPIVAAAHVVTALQTVVSRRLPPYEPAIVTIGRIEGGSARNVIPDRVTLSGTLRTMTSAARATAKDAIRQIAGQTAAAHGATAEVVFTEGYPVLVNDTGLAEYLRSVARSELGDDVVREVPLSLGGEDFAYFGERVPAVMWRLGVGGSATDPLIPLHSSRFDFADAAIPIGVRLHCAAVLNWPKG